jgi:hypothetical protein
VQPTPLVLITETHAHVIGLPAYRRGMRCRGRHLRRGEFERQQLVRVRENERERERETTAERRQNKTERRTAERRRGMSLE